jgi:hypothetical protein
MRNAERAPDSDLPILKPPRLSGTPGLAGRGTEFFNMQSSM